MHNDLRVLLAHFQEMKQEKIYRSLLRHQDLRLDYRRATPGIRSEQAFLRNEGAYYYLSQALRMLPKHNEIARQEI